LNTEKIYSSLPYRSSTVRNNNIITAHAEISK
jgi:hypothetical protein